MGRFAAASRAPFSGSTWCPPPIRQVFRSRPPRRVTLGPVPPRKAMYDVWSKLVPQCRDRGDHVQNIQSPGPRLVLASPIHDLRTYCQRRACSPTQMKSDHSHCMFCFLEEIAIALPPPPKGNPCSWILPASGRVTLAYSCRITCCTHDIPTRTRC